MDIFKTSSAIFVSAVTIDIIIKSIFTFGIFIVLKNFIAKTIIRFCKNIADKGNIKGISVILDSIEQPLKTFFLFAGIYFALIIFPLNNNLVIWLHKLFRCIIIITVARCFLRLNNSYTVWQERINKTEENSIIKTIAPILNKIIKVLIIVIALAAIASEFGYKLNSLLAGLGIGGLAVAMAAQDALKNFFGGFVIITDHPFNTGDIINIDNNEGVVEDIGLRSTKIRTFEKELITVPNSKISDGSVVNYSRRGLRRVKFHVGATYSTTADKLKKAVNEIQSMLKDHKQVDSDSIIVKFDGFGGSSLDILVMYFIKTPDYAVYMDVKEEINFTIMKIFEKENIEFAFPSMSIYFENELTRR